MGIQIFPVTPCRNWLTKKMCLKHSSNVRSGFAKLSLIGGLLSLSAFALAGYLGDRYGRKKLGVVGILVKTAVDAWLQRQPWHALLQLTHYSLLYLTMQDPFLQHRMWLSTVWLLVLSRSEGLAASFTTWMI